MYFSKCLDEGICPIEVVLKTYFIIYDAWPIFWQIIQIFYSVLLNMFNVFCIYCLHLLALVLFMNASNLKKNPSIFEWTSMHKSVKFSNTFLKQALISNIYSNGWSDCHVDCQTLLNAAKTKSIIHCLFVSLVTKSRYIFLLALLLL